MQQTQKKHIRTSRTSGSSDPFCSSSAGAGELLLLLLLLSYCFWCDSVEDGGSGSGCDDGGGDGKGGGSNGGGDWCDKGVGMAATGCSSRPMMLAATTAGRGIPTTPRPRPCFW